MPRDEQSDDDRGPAIIWRPSASGNYCTRYRGRRLVVFERPTGYGFLVVKPDGRGGETKEWGPRTYPDWGDAARAAYEVAERRRKGQRRV